jgi:hypothetical protein
MNERLLLEVERFKAGGPISARTRPRRSFQADSPSERSPTRSGLAALCELPSSFRKMWRLTFVSCGPHRSLSLHLYSWTVET